jgi:MFS family permease
MMQAAAILWHIYQITGSALALGLVGLVRIIPVIGFSLLSGLVADRFDRRKLMMLSQSGMALCAMLLGYLAWRNTPSAWPIYLLAAASSTFGAFDLPARQALIPALVPREDLPNAFSLNATMFQAASVIGPALGGMILAHIGLHWAYWLNAVSFLAILGALLMISHRPSLQQVENRATLTLHSAIEGLRFVRN